MAKNKKEKPQPEGKGILQTGRSDDAPAWLIQRTARLLRVLFIRLVQDGEVDVTPEMWTVLSRLVARDGQYQSELAAATYRDRPNMSRILAGMESRDLVFRRPDKEDRRKSRVYLTPEARQLVAATTPLAARTRDRLYEGLRKKELKALRSALRQIESNTLAVLAELEQGTESETPPR
ncbi:MAG: MarR family winged helix-turn-helix transcriptional regulator [Planctomycetota bacterium]|jgi:DNA-binding MarR family transcriptional regulator